MKLPGRGIKTTEFLLENLSLGRKGEFREDFLLALIRIQQLTEKLSYNTDDYFITLISFKHYNKFKYIS